MRVRASRDSFGWMRRKPSVTYAMWRAGLDLVAKGLTIGELERELGQQFPDLLSTANKATEFVGHLVATAEA